jgi:hypothetical protein
VISSSIHIGLNGKKDDRCNQENGSDRRLWQYELQKSARSCIMANVNANGFCKLVEFQKLFCDSSNDFDEKWDLQEAVQKM